MIVGNLIIQNLLSEIIKFAVVMAVENGLIFCRRGLSVERGESEVGSKGRAVHRKDSTATGASSLLSGSAASEPLVDPLAHRVRVQSSNMC